MPVVVKGLTSTLNALKEFEPDLKKELDAKIRQAAKPVVNAAKGYVPKEIPGLRTGWMRIGEGKKPMSGAAWKRAGLGDSTPRARFPLFNPSYVKAGIKFTSRYSKTNAAGFMNLYRIQNKTAAGAIYETAGRKNQMGQAWNPKSSSHDVSHSRNPYAGYHFNLAIESSGSMKGKNKLRGRLIYRAWEENGGRVTNAAGQAVNDIIERFHVKTRRIAA